MNRTMDTPRFTDSSIEGQGILSDGVCCVCGRYGIIVSFPGRLGMRLWDYRLIPRQVGNETMQVVALFYSEVGSVPWTIVYQ